MADTTWTIKRMLDWTTEYLQKKGDEHPRLSAEWLINNVTGLSRVEIYMNFDRVLSQKELHVMHDAVLRRSKGEPLQYVTGEMPFRHIILRCETGVLIPRPETEVLVDAALEGVDAAVARGELWPNKPKDVQVHNAHVAGASAVSQQSDEEDTAVGPAVSSFAGSAQDAQTLEEETDDEPIDPIVWVPGPEQSHTQQHVLGPGEAEALADTSEDSDQDIQPKKELLSGPRVLEVGCGTGCIALSMASERPGTHVFTTDLSPQAVALAMRNRDALKLEDFVDIIQCDLASGIDPQLMGTFSVFVSNPPYIPSAVIPNLPQEVVGYEPGLALDGGPDGLDVFRKLLDLAPRVLAPSGVFCCELFETNVQTAAELCKQQGGWSSVEVREDLTHRPRVLVAVRAA